VKVTAEYFLDSFGEPIGRGKTAGGRWSAVPGLMRLFELSHQKHGKLSWKAPFQPAKNLQKTDLKFYPAFVKP